MPVTDVPAPVIVALLVVAIITEVPALKVWLVGLRFKTVPDPVIVIVDDPRLIVLTLLLFELNELHVMLKLFELNVPRVTVKLTQVKAS
jgi:hypothetical protein